MNIKEAKDFKNYAVKHHGMSSMHVEKYMDAVGQSGIHNLTRTVIEERPMPSIIQAQLLFLESSDNRSDVQIYINSPGGEVYSGLGIYDTMQYVNMDVATICTGMAASMAAVLLCAGQKGKRTALRHARVMIHQPLGGIGGKTSDIMISLQEMRKIKEELYVILEQHSGQPMDKIVRDADRDYWMRAQEAKEYGMIDEVLVRNKGNKEA